MAIMLTCSRLPAPNRCRDSVGYWPFVAGHQPIETGSGGMAGGSELVNGEGGWIGYVTCQWQWIGH